MMIPMNRLANQATRARYAYEDALASLRELQAEVDRGLRFEDLEPASYALRDIGQEVSELEAVMIDAEDVVFWALVADFESASDSDPV